MAKARAWVFTFNNYTDADESTIQGIDSTYLVYGREVAPTTGTPHLQGYIYFKNARSRKSLVKKGFSCFIAPAKGTSLANLKYASKDKNVFESGTRPATPTEKGNLEKDRWKAIWESAKSGSLEDIEPSVRVQNYRTLKQISVDHAVKPPDLDGPCGYWIWGKPGTGKTHLARKQYPTAYIKQRNKWFDGYDGEETVILDDMDPYAKALGGLIKDWTSSWAFRAETKGSTAYIRPKRFIITSQYTPEQIWEDTETVAAIRDRCIFVHKSGESWRKKKKRTNDFAHSEPPPPSKKRLIKPTLVRSTAIDDNGSWTDDPSPPWKQLANSSTVRRHRRALSVQIPPRRPRGSSHGSSLCYVIPEEGSSQASPFQEGSQAQAQESLQKQDC
jgi:hypothetical protein